MTEMTFYIALLFFSVVISQFSQILLKKSALKEHKGFIQEYVNPYVITAYSIFFCGVLIDLFALKKVPVSYIPVIEASGYIIIIFLSRVLLKEMFTKRKISAICTIFTGIAVYLGNF